MSYQLLGKFLEIRNKKEDIQLIETMKGLGYYE